MEDGGDTRLRRPHRRRAPLSQPGVARGTRTACHGRCDRRLHGAVFHDRGHVRGRLGVARRRRRSRRRVARQHPGTAQRRRAAGVARGHGARAGARATARPLRRPCACHPRRQGGGRVDAPVRARPRGRRGHGVVCRACGGGARLCHHAAQVRPGGRDGPRRAGADAGAGREAIGHAEGRDGRGARRPVRCCRARGVRRRRPDGGAFLRGVDFYAKGQVDQAATQLAIAAGPRREFFPAAFFLGAAFASVGRDRDAAGVWQQSMGTEPRPPAFYAMVADARLRDGIPDAAIDILKPPYAGAARQRRDRTAAGHGVRDDHPVRRGDAGARRAAVAASHRAGAAAGGDRQPVRAGAGRPGAVGGRRGQDAALRRRVQGVRVSALARKTLEAIQAK